ncbi:cytochrome P450 [Artomyces pyxidatus]|uniref:Cytochrome P450 n=1 Tax=Artomyces pyxidatus TaxID=48021 RepID=A0ACB8SUC9_9AGAM|nr:cytochrome P450 [Artomyces pyxidatus]
MADSPFGLRAPSLPAVFSFRAWSVGLLAAAIFYIVGHWIKQTPLWKIRGPPSVSFITGNYSQMFHVGAADFHKYITKTYGRVIRINGFFWDSQLVVSDPKACTTILLKEQDVFEEAHWFLEGHRHALGVGLLATLGAHHRRQRKLLNPVFSIKHMRSLTPLFHGITHHLCDVLQTKVAGGPAEINMVEWLNRLALELIAQGGLGYTFNSLDPDVEENEFGKAVKEFTPTLSSLIVFRRAFPLVSRWPKRLRRFGAKLLPLPMVHNMIRVTDILKKCTKEIYEEKKALLERGDDVFKQQLSEGKDIISVLMKANIDAPAEDRLPDEEILGQMTTLLFAASDTTSSALSRILQLLSQHPVIQENLREELNEACSRSGKTDLDYNELVSLPYLDAVCRETLRVFPPVAFAYRVTRADTSLPLSQPIQTATGAQSSVFVPCGTAVAVNIIGLNRDPHIWGADAAEWRPARWLGALPATVAEARIPGVYANTLTFIGGGRACIGFKFSQLEMKVVLSHLVRAFRFSPSKTEIVWKFGGIASPSVKGSTDVRPQLPMVVERV